MLDRPVQPHCDSRRATGIPLRLLLDKRDHFLPDNMSRFFEQTAIEPTARFYKEAEVIWQAVSEETWVELDNYIEEIRQRCIQIEIRLRQRASWNMFTSEARAAWRDSWQFYYGKDSLWTEYRAIVRHSGYSIHFLREKYISQFNAKHPELDPPLRQSDKLTHRLSGLPSFKRDYVAYLRREGFEPARCSGLFEDALAHVKRRGGIHFDDRATPDFDVTVDGRAHALPKDGDILGLPSLLPPPRHSPLTAGDGRRTPLTTLDTCT
ncbi:BZ3500_MvSof-1268-A1-R1_Chr9g10471 [Microbotryum saponariae]|uniref:BZ3500_MvSof-1268-A1-R1_Chr9g10471 protein n=1 Tax=Microbotryum saponariae TaxID=289078 RepID=A0A2X0LUL6_9BASI|nr:BZ3501_MvSof-1269-A2-R1_Chr9g10221 [Microbotryum saponariae]SDA00145.1 BZ3500_MvSof-1268-A1-R1_Chr9g10471 [Microbotryum saponariae]